MKTTVMNTQMIANPENRENVDSLRIIDNGIINANTIMKIVCLL